MTENVNGNPNSEQFKSSKFNNEDDVKISEEIKEFLKAFGIGYDDPEVRERLNNQKQLLKILTARMKHQKECKESKKRPAKPRAKRKSASYRHLSMLDVVISSKDPHKLYNPHEAAEFLGLTVWAVRKRIQRGTIYAELVDNAYVIPHAELVRKIRQAFHFKKR